MAKPGFFSLPALKEHGGGNLETRRSDRFAALIACTVILLFCCFFLFGYLAARKADAEVDAAKRKMLIGFVEKEIDSELGKLSNLAVSDHVFEAVQSDNTAEIGTLCREISGSNYPQSFSVVRFEGSVVFNCDFGRVGEATSQDAIVEYFALNSSDGFEAFIEAQRDFDRSFAEFSYQTILGEYNDDAYLIFRAPAAPAKQVHKFDSDSLSFIFTVQELNRIFVEALESEFGFEGLKFSNAPPPSAVSVAIGENGSGNTDQIYAHWSASTAFSAQFWSAIPYVATIAGMLIIVLLFGLSELRKLIRIITQKESEMRHLANHDSATGLANRRYFKERVHQLINSNPNSNFVFGFVDLDFFKSINDTHGHDAGDAVIVETANRLEKGLLGPGVVGRLGGDEFAFFVQVGTSFDDQLKLVNQLHKKLSEHVHLNGRIIDISASIGVAQFPYDGAGYSTVAKAADLALYEAKDNGRGRWEIYNSEMNRIELRSVSKRKG